MATSGAEGQRHEMRLRLLQGVPVEERQMEVAGIRTSVLLGGSGPPMVLLHGGIQAGGVVWWRVLPRLVESHRVVVPDLPGLGETESGTGRLDAPLVARWLGELIRATCPERPALVAHSAPASFAARFAIDRGDQLDRLVLVDPGGILRAGLPPLGLLVAAIRSTMRPNPANFERFLRRVTYDLDRLRQEDERWPEFARYTLARAVLPSVKRTMRQAAKVGLKGSISEAELRRISVPVTVIWGRHDRLTPLPLGERLRAELSWPLRLIEDSGHLPHVEQPKAFTDALLAATLEA